MQNAAIEHAGLDWKYLAFDVDPKQLKEAIEGAKAMKFVGLNLTVPHKLLALDMMDILDAGARTWGAVNTVLFEAQGYDEQWQPVYKVDPVQIRKIRAKGYNTDADAIVQAIQEDLSITVKGARILLLGAGGAGRVAALRFAAEGARSIFLINRTVRKATELQNEIRNRFPLVEAEVGYPWGNVDIVVNATSLGLSADDPLPLDEKCFSLSKARKVYDMIYRPAKTPFLELAKKSGCEVSNGLGMLLYQGAKAFEIWSGQQAPLAKMKQALRTAVYGPEK